MGGRKYIYNHYSGHIFLSKFGLHVRETSTIEYWLNCSDFNKVDQPGFSRLWTCLPIDRRNQGEFPCFQNARIQEHLETLFGKSFQLFVNESYSGPGQESYQAPGSGDVWRMRP